MPGADTRHRLQQGQVPQPGPLQEITKSPERRALLIPLAGSQRPLQPLRVLLGVPSYSEQDKSPRKQVITGDHTPLGAHPASIEKPKNTDKVKVKPPTHGQAEQTLSCPTMEEEQGATFSIAKESERGTGKPICPGLVLPSCLPLSLGELTNGSPPLGASFPPHLHD